MQIQPIAATLLIATTSLASAQGILPGTNDWKAFAKELQSVPEKQCAQPKYTDTPRSLEQVSIVEITYHLSAKGDVESVSVAGGDRNMLGILTLRYLGGCKAPPVQLAGMSYPARITVPVEWKLDGVTNPRVQFTAACRPVYPESAKRREAQGKTTLRVSVSESGEVLNPVVVTSSGHQDLDNAAKTAIIACKATPGLSNGKPREKTVTVGYSWQLE